jgi:hypothetical protein
MAGVQWREWRERTRWRERGPAVDTVPLTVGTAHTSDTDTSAQTYLDTVVVETQELPLKKQLLSYQGSRCILNQKIKELRIGLLLNFSIDASDEAIQRG